MKCDLNCFDSNSIELYIFCRLYFDFVLSSVFKHKVVLAVLSSAIWVLYQGRIFLRLVATGRKNITDLFECTQYKVSIFFFMFSFVVYANLATSLKRLETELKNIKTALLFITWFLCWIFLYFLSFIKTFFHYLLVLTYFDSSRWQYTHETTHATGMQIVCNKMTSLDMIFCRGNKSSSRSLALFRQV